MEISWNERQRDEPVKADEDVGALLSAGVECSVKGELCEVESNNGIWVNKGNKSGYIL